MIFPDFTSPEYTRYDIQRKIIKIHRTLSKGTFSEKASLL